jgi:hypothetical protein
MKAQNAEFAHFAERLKVKGAGKLVLCHAGHDFLFGKSYDLLLEHELLFGKGKIHECLLKIESCRE